MSRLITSILLLFFITTHAQIPMKKLVSFVGSKYSPVADFLRQEGWEFKGSDTSGGLHTIWAYRHNDTAKNAARWLYCFFSSFPDSNKDSITSIGYLSVSQAEYLYFLNNLSSLGFEKTKTRDYQGKLSVIFEKKLIKDNPNLMIELLQYTIPTADSRITKYQISLGYYN